MTHCHIIPKSLPWSGDCGVVAATWLVLELGVKSKQMVTDILIDAHWGYINAARRLNFLYEHRRGKGRG